MLLQLTEPNSVAVGIDLGTTQSLVAISEEGQVRFLTDLSPSEVNSIRSFKRSMTSPHNIILNNETALTLSHQLLCDLKKRAEESLGCPISQAVITVPAHFDDIARQATKQAATLAGLQVLRLINEPTAAALAYGIDTNYPEGLYLVYDFGGGTFDVSLLHMEKGVFQVLKTAGDLELGGDDIDQAIQIYAQTQDLKQAKDLKERGGEVVDVCAKPFIDKTIKLCQEVLRDIPGPLQNILLVGGSSRLEGVKKAIERTFSITPLCTKNPEHVVAIGAAVQAEALTSQVKHLLLDVTPLSLGIETMGGLVEKIIPRNTPIPVQASEEFTTFQDNQNAIKIHVVQGESEFIGQCRSLAEFTLKGIPAMPASIPRLEVIFHIDADGILSVTAREKRTGMTQTLEVNSKSIMTPNELNVFLKTSAQEIKERLITEIRLKAQQLVHYARKINEPSVQESVSLLEHLILQGSFDEIKKHMDIVSILLQPLIEKNMTAMLQNTKNKI